MRRNQSVLRRSLRSNLSPLGPILFLAVVAWGCDHSDFPLALTQPFHETDEGEEPVDPEVTSVVVDPASVILGVGELLQLRAEEHLSTGGIIDALCQRMMQQLDRAHAAQKHVSA